jgi:DNA repair exonuclease SbcCD nuclease subunit
MKLVHSADWQLGWAQYGLRSRLRDFEIAAENIFRLALEQKAGALILAGDIFDTNRPPARSVELVRKGVAELAKAGCQTLGILGNHDMSEQDDPNQSDWLRICGAINVHGRSAILTGKDDEQVLVIGIDRRRPAQLLEELRTDTYKLAELAAQKVPVILVLHQMLAEVSPFGADGLSAAALAEILGPMGVQYVAMGDVHEYRHLEVGGVKFCYPGSTEMTDINEPRQKWASIIDIVDGQIKPSRIETPSRRIIQLRIDKEEDLEPLRMQIANSRPHSGGDSPPPLLYLEVNRELNLIPKLEKWYEHFPKCISTYAGAGDMSKVFDKPIWEREGAVLQLGRAVEAFHAAGTDENQLILEILKSPDAVEDVMSNYFAQKGLNYNDYRSAT